MVFQRKGASGDVTAGWSGPQRTDGRRCCCEGQPETLVYTTQDVFPSQDTFQRPRALIAQEGGRLELEVN